ncbi:MAG: asparaginase [bacterium]|jgi:L-asparaginase
MQKKVVVVSTGGTIAMKYDPVRKGVFPAVTGAELVEAVPPLADVCPVDVVEFSNIPSAHMTPQTIFKLAHFIDETLAKDDVSGVVVTHGTDTLEETAYFLDLVLKSEKPVCVTGAMRHAGDVSPDGPKNILCSVKVAAAPEAVGKGVFVVLNEEIHAAREVTKTHSGNPKTFASPFWGPLGYVDEDRVIFRRQPIDRLKIQPENIVDDVHLIKVSTGVDDFLLKCLVDKGAKGIVVEGFGRGNIPPAMVPGIKLAIDNGIPVVLTTRSAGGRVLDVYGFEGSAKTLKELGVIFGGEISGQKARLKLILALGITEDHEKLAAYFDVP